MNRNRLPLLVLVLISFLHATFGKAQTLKSALLENTGEIPFPKSEPISIFLTVGLQPEIIGTMKVPVEVDMNGIAMIASSLGKGKLLLIATDAYFKAALLKEKSVQQLFLNAIKISQANTSKATIAVTKNADKALLAFLASKNLSTYTTADFKLKKETTALFLTEDITDSSQMKNIETFIRGGGTLVFGSPYESLDKISKQTPGAESPFLALNALFAKAGVINQNLLGNPKNKVLITNDTARYLHINTMLERMSSTAVKTKTDDYIEYFLTNPSLEMAFRYNDSNAPAIKLIKDYFAVPDTIPVPSLTRPIVMDTERKKAAMKMAYRLYLKKQDFARHPNATFPGYESFPGKISEGAKRVSEEVSIPVMVGTQGLLDPPSVYLRPHTTGLYIPAGERVQISIPSSYLSQHLTAQIGVHNDDVTNLGELTRTGIDLTTTFKLDHTTTEVFSPFGGLLLIGISDTTSLKKIKIQVNGAVKAPYFKLGETTEAEWNATIRNNPAPWAELATDNIVLTVPSYRIRNLSNPAKVMQFWDEVMDADADLAVISRKRAHQERIIVDQQVAYGYMFTMNTKIVVPDDQSTEWMLDADFIREKGSWGAFHEIGHRHQFWGLDFPGTGEVTVNLFSMYVYDQVLKKGIYNHENIPDFPTVIKKIKAYLADGPSLEKWSNEPFLALSMYIQIINQFGWDPIKKANTAYRNLPKSKYPKTDQDKRDLWFTTISKTTNSNLTRFFDTWKIPVSDGAKKQVKSLKEWFPKELE